MVEPRAQPGRYVNKTVTFAAGQHLSSMIDCSAGTPVFVFMPNEWTAARLSFQVSPDGTYFYDLFDNMAQEVTFNVTAGTGIRIDPNWSPVTFLKLRSGSRSAPRPQESDLSITVVLDTVG